MSDFRNPNDPMGNYGYEPASGPNAGWGWLAGAIVLLIVLGLAFGVGREPSRVASNDAAPSAVNSMTPHPSTMNSAAPPAAPGLTPPPAQAPTTTPDGQ